MSESKLRKAEKKGFHFTVFEKDPSNGKVVQWMCKSPGFVSIKKSACGLGKNQEDAFDDCCKHMQDKKVNEKIQPKMSKK